MAENFSTYFRDIAQKQKSDFLKDFSSKAIIAHCSSGYQHSLKEILTSQAMNQKIQQMSCAQEQATLDRFFETLATCEDKATYGPKSVDVAIREMAVETLLISDKLFRSKNTEQRKHYVRIHDKALRDGITVVVFNS